MITNHNVRIVINATIQVDDEVPDHEGVVECFINDEVHLKLRNIPGMTNVEITEIEHT
jgi:hypothetical protein